jgi:translocation and assembly module TamB
VGGWHFQRKELLDAKITGQIRRDTLARFLPAQPQFGAVTFDLAASGAWENLRHQGEASADSVSFSGVKPLGANLTWRGLGMSVTNFTAKVAAGETTVVAVGSANKESMELSSLQFSKAEAPLLHLTRPVIVRWTPGLIVDGLHLAGNDSSIDAELSWGTAGKVAVALRNFSSSWLTPVVALPGPIWELHTLALQGAWDGGPMTFSAVIGGTVDIGNQRKASVNLAARGSKDGIRLEALRAADGPNPIVNVVGLLPIVLAPANSKFVSIDPRGIVEFDADSSPHAAFWGQLAAMTGLELKEPRFGAHVRGTWSRPTGSLQIQAGRVAFDPKRLKRSAPALELLDVAITGDSAGLLLEKLNVRIEGQALSANGRLPIGETNWQKFFKTPLAFIQRSADLRIEIPQAEIAAFARFLPAFMAAKGRFHLDLTYQAGMAAGTVRLTDAATRPLGPLGVLQEVQAEVALVKNVVELRKVTAKSGGEEVRLAGKVALPDWNFVGDEGGGLRGEPKFELTLKGQNLPFVRRTGLLLRGDLDINLTTTPKGKVRLGGTVRLRDSLFLQDVRALIPGGTASKGRRPPYFAVENAPLDEWLLDLTVEGDHFLRVRTALFNGVASARFHLGGTLGEPMALGEMTINKGAVRLPFATFDVREGRVTLTPEQPYEPQLWLSATSRRFNYDMRMEVAGAAGAPILTFSSSPPLEHGQVLLMVMTGQAPKDEVTFTDQQRAARLGTFLGQSLLASFGDAENAERLNISTGEKISRQGRETYDIEYRFNEKWSVTGEYDEFDNYNAGLKWRVYSRGGERPVEARNAKQK